MSTASLDARLFQDGWLVDLSIGFWAARKRNDHEDLGLSPSDVPEYVVGIGTKRLIPAEYTSDWGSIAGRARKVLKRASFHFPLAQASYVPITAWPAAEEGLTALKIEYEESTGAFVKRFDTIKADFLRSLKKKDRDRIVHEIPAKDVVAAKFYFTWASFTIALPKKMRLVVADAKAREAQEAAQKRAEADLETKVARFVAASVTELRSRIAETFTGLGERIKEGHAVTDRSLGVIRRTVEDFKRLNFFGDERIDQYLDAFQRQFLGTDADGIDKAVSQAMQKQCAQIAQAAMQVSDINAVTGRYHRRLLMEPPAAQ